MEKHRFALVCMLLHSDTTTRHHRFTSLSAAGSVGSRWWRTGGAELSPRAPNNLTGALWGRFPLPACCERDRTILATARRHCVTIQNLQRAFWLRVKRIVKFVCMWRRRDCVLDCQMARVLLLRNINGRNKSLWQVLAVPMTLEFLWPSYLCIQDCHAWVHAVDEPNPWSLPYGPWMKGKRHHHYHVISMPTILLQLLIQGPTMQEDTLLLWINDLDTRSPFAVKNRRVHDEAKRCWMVKM
ncbi:uncharacterized protein BDR25DRAFT_357921 [Lindgomyces ingoldianus]|uniref:Uncharacterized protein n=1 Tax=Lindgomyces ingoldianus TaxID=673940 RepID=A0ACB6QPF8_9PLEO|nr:uncharacterized protein BDR25DRAFT_357921 [Lindgomyces ingoldianus]KAF2468177.1 hypothetical protein BDR25DRAFT_357921 [Lindgomyces ingoldianus]